MQDILEFVLLLAFEIPAVFLSILVFIYFITHRRAGFKPKNHVWLVVLVVTCFQLIVNLPMPMSFYYLGEIWPATNAYCLWWSWFEYSTTAISVLLMAWASIERHLFIFHSTFMLGGAWKKWLFHLIPILLCILWPSLWYLVLIVISPNCTNVWDFGYVICGLPCYTSTDDGIYGIVDTMLTIVIPLSIVIFANTALFVRVIYMKISHHQIVNWRRHRKMAFQLWLISSLYLVGWLPLTIVLLIRMIALPSFLDDQLAIMIYTLNFIPLLLPFIYLVIFPEIINRIREVLRGQQQQQQQRNQVASVLVPLQTNFRTKQPVSQCPK